MEANREEAIRARDIAEIKMQNKDFFGARKIVLKAQSLCNVLENLQHMLTTCNVHCAAEHKLLGGEMDWYGILHIQQTADEATIKKQYRKFALQLHPDKNKFPGAEAAFKLIGEAQRVLLDKNLRSLHDHKRKISSSKPATTYRTPHTTAQGTNVGFQNNIRSNFTGNNPATQQGFSNGQPTFWTTCPFCKVKYQYLLQVVNRSVRCQTCSKAFIANIENNFTQPAFPKKPDFFNQCSRGVNAGQRQSSSTTFFKTEIPQKRSGSTGFAVHSESEFSQRKSEFNSQNANSKKRKKQEASSSEDCDSESNDDTDEEIFVEKDDEFKAGVKLEKHGENPRRSNRSKQKVSYRENMSDDEDIEDVTEEANGSGGASNVNGQCDSATGLKDQNIMRQEQSSENASNGTKETEDKKADLKVEKNVSRKNSEVHADSTVDSNSDSDSDPDPVVYSCPEPEFNDFDKDREENCFSMGQIWACYDSLDAMPRFYAWIRKVFSPRFKLRITWLEPDPDDKNEKNWVKEGLPTSCGKFTLGKTENTEDRPMFSHLVCCEKGIEKDTYKVFPQKGETWALFKDWDINWDSDDDRQFEYEFVEILTEYSESACLWVGFLGKIKGFVSLFCRVCKDGMEKINIPRDELFRFSHRVPSFKMTGQERDGVPKGSFELDPASLPESMEEIAIAGVANIPTHAPSSVKGEDMANGSEAKLQPEDESDGKNGGHDSSPATAMEGGEVQETEFFNFDKEKSVEKLSVGQIWSIYSEDEDLPKYYGKITDVRTDPLEIQVNCLVPCVLPRHVIPWHDKDIPICCGRFKPKRDASLSFDSTASFSQQMTVIQYHKKNEYTILPMKSQVWAMYINWSPKITSSELKNCKYEIVEVLEEQQGTGWKVSALEQVNGFNSVFKPRVKVRDTVVTEVSQSELLRFSHQVTAFRLTDEKGGSLRGFWEIDPQALPASYLGKEG